MALYLGRDGLIGNTNSQFADSSCPARHTGMNLRTEEASGSIWAFTPPQLCTRAVSVCARELQPLGVEIGGTLTVKIERHYRSTYSCAIVNGKPAWVVISTEGSCEAQPVITLPAKYDDDEAWNVG